MSKAFKITLAVIAAVVLVGLVVPNLLPARIRTSRLDRYMCLKCAARRDMISRQWFTVPYDGTDKVTATLLSHCIANTTDADCKHEWARIYFDVHGANESGHGGVSSPLVLHFLTETEDIVAGIVCFADSLGLPPQEIWRTLFLYVANDKMGQTSMLDDAITSGRIFDQPFDGWLKENYLKLKQKPANQVPEVTARKLADQQR